MDFIAILLGRYLLEFFGSLIRYSYLNLGNLMGINNYTPFSNVWAAKGNIDKKSGNSEKNHMIGVIFFWLNYIFFDNL